MLFAFEIYLALAIGAAIGFFAAALLHVGHDDDIESERLRRPLRVHRL